MPTQIITFWNESSREAAQAAIERISKEGNIQQMTQSSAHHPTMDVVTTVIVVYGPKAEYIPKTKITVEGKPGTRYIASLEGKPGGCAGDNAYEALGRLVSSHIETLGIEIFKKPDNTVNDPRR